MNDRISADKQAVGSAPGRLVDPRGSRFAASITSVLLAVVLVTIPSTLASVLLGLQWVVFAVAAFAGLRFSPYGWLFRVLVRPRLGPPTEMEEEAPPRFAQLVGFAFATVGSVALLLGWAGLAVAAVALALAAAFLNAAFGYCLGCELYLLLRRMTSR